MQTPATTGNRFRKLHQLNFMDLLVLQRLTAIKKPTIRYQLMQDIRNTLGDEELPTAKFYRILEKLYQLNLVGFLPEDEEQKKYFITEEGYAILKDALFVSAQITTTVFSLIIDQIPKIKSFVGGDAENSLLIDQIGIIGVEFIKEIKKHTKSFSILTNDDQYTWLKANLKSLENTIYRDGIIKEPDNWFDMIMILYPTAPNNQISIEECYRVLKENGRLVLIEIINPIKRTNHFLIEALAENFIHPVFKLKDKKEIDEYYKEITEMHPWKNTAKYEWNGLYLLRLDK